MYLPDMAGSSKGKILPVERFIKSVEDQSQNRTQFLGRQLSKWVYESEVIDASRRIYLCLLIYLLWGKYLEQRTYSANYLWFKIWNQWALWDCTKTSVNECHRTTKGWKSAVVAPELEFYLCEQNLDPDLPLKTPVGKSGRRETGSRVFGIDAVNEFDALTDDIYDYCELMDIGVDTLVRESYFQ